MGVNFLEKYQVEPVFPAVVVGNANTSPMTTGDYVNLANALSVTILFACGDGNPTSGDITPTLYQAQDNAGTGAKVLSVLETGRIYERVNASTLAATGTWTKVTQATASETYDDTGSGEEVSMIALQVYPSDLDADNNFDHLRCDLAAISSAKLVAAVYIVEMDINTAPELMPTVQ